MTSIPLGAPGAWLAPCTALQEQVRSLLRVCMIERAQPRIPRCHNPILTADTEAGSCQVAVEYSMRMS